MEEERRDHEAKMKKMEQEMEQVFEMKVKEKTQKLKDSETDVTEISLDSSQFLSSTIFHSYHFGYFCFIFTVATSTRTDAPFA